MELTVCFAYYADGKFIGWYGGTFGGLSNCPKLYTFTDSQCATIKGNLTHKLNKVNSSSFNEEKEEKKGLAALSLAVFDGEELLRGKEVELRVVECPEYDGENPNFDELAYTKALDARKELMKSEGIFDIPAPSMDRFNAIKEFDKRHPKPKCDNWIYADYNKVKEWAKNEPTEFLHIIKPLAVKV